MALGFSGSNGGVALKQQFLQSLNFESGHKIPLEVSYFINNVCNLKCKHCYVGYKKAEDSLSIEEWEKIFNELIEMGARTFGNVGKEPLLDWEKTRELLKFFQDKRKQFPELRFGIVTNGTLLNEQKIKELEEIAPDYIDISLDGNKDVHDSIRGAGNYDKLFKNLSLLSRKKLAQKIFISFTLNKINASCIGEAISSIYNLGIKKLLISPYVSLENKDNPLFISNEEIIEKIKDLLNGNIIDFKKFSGLEIYIKNDYTVTKELMEQMADKKIIDKDNLYLDEYGVIFNKYEFGDNTIYFNYLPFDESYVKAIRISHDGYISDCYSMFFEDYPKKAIGNIKEKPIKEILESHNSSR